MRPAQRLTFLIFLIVISGPPVHAQQGWKKMLTVEDVHQRFPERIDSLFHHLDLSIAGFERVRSALAEGNSSGACNELIRYYRHGKSAPFLRRAQPGATSINDSEADSIVRNIFTFYETPDVVPRHPNGQLNWSYQGPAHDIEWAWGLNRHYHILTLLESYFKTGNPLYA
ncbi:MAG TPA: heparinase II/III family protein, partial [Chryseosolibacter sp.]|nr:heparinase II/III family protein [Chryseosolibacter sp.]